MLIPLLNDPDQKVRFEASLVLRRMKQNKDAAPAFMAMLKDENFEIRRTAVTALADFCDEPGVAEALKSMLKDRDQAVVRRRKRL